MSRTLRERPALIFQLEAEQQSLAVFAVTANGIRRMIPRSVPRLGSKLPSRRGLATTGEGHFSLMSKAWLHGGTRGVVVRLGVLAHFAAAAYACRDASLVREAPVSVLPSGDAPPS